MHYINAGDRRVYRSTHDPAAPVIYVVDAPEHPFEIADIANGLACTVVKVPISEWNDSLTPWPAPGLYRGEADFKGGASRTLAALCDEVIPLVEREEGLAPTRRAICGYSLGGLFALYAFTHSDRFNACACLSGSVWYEGWVEHLRGLDFDGTGTFAFLSIGTKEKRAALAILRTVQDNMQACADILRSHGCETEYAVGPGNHMQLHRERFAAGLAALDAHLQ
ncbi:MAG: alpha/beta hydrolase-fold protein [Coriobacteriia bacterium]|nr:alpha/beta hydrolase-fold protein [Coriobacteriia bacterium]